MSDRTRRIGTSPHYGAPTAPFFECLDCGGAIFNTATHEPVCPGRTEEENRG